MNKRDIIISKLNRYLNIEKIPDYLPKGLLVEGTQNVSKIITGVSSSVDLFKAAVKAQAQMVIVHHGIFWKNESPVLKGSLKKRVKILLENNITLLGYHLPLDCHPV
ncbi:MAG: Nif3-like dinuclear metal center hexameric protein, partial [bacterium]